MFRLAPSATPSRSTLTGLLLAAALSTLVACSGDEPATEETPAEAPHTEEVSPEPTYEPAAEVIDPENTEGTDVDPAQLAAENASDDPNAPQEEPQPAKSSEPDVD